MVDGWAVGANDVPDVVSEELVNGLRTGWGGGGMNYMQLLPYPLPPELGVEVAVVDVAMGVASELELSVVVIACL